MKADEHDPEEIPAPFLPHWALGRPRGPYRGTFPCGLLSRLDERWNIKDDGTEVLFPFGGATPDRENWIVNDIEESLDVDTHHDATDLPDEWENRFDVVIEDPPYGEEMAEDLYGVDYAGPKAHMMEAARVVKPGGYVLILDWLVYTNWPTHDPDGYDLTREEPIAVTCGPNTRVRILNIFQKPPREE